MEKLISLENVSKHFHVGKNRTLVAVNDITLDIYKGETLGVVGESGCGKSTLGRVVMGIYPATKGKMTYNGKVVNIKKTKDRYEYAKKAQIIFQDPYASLNPRMTVGSIIAEGMEIHNMYDKKKRMERVYELLETVGLNKEHANRFPHEFSGGQRQRIGIARALAIEPEFIVCDEPISALDVSIQSQIINLLKEIQEKNGFTYITDKQGRVIKATGKLKNIKGIRSVKNQNIAAKMGRVGDEGGHLIPANYGGSGSLINHVPQTRTVNRSVIKRIENEMGRALRAGKKVEYTIMPHYPNPDTLRPDKFTIRYVIDGVQKTRRIANV